MSRFLLILATFALLVGCSQSSQSPTQESNIELFSDKTCDAPCLLGITPGITTEGEAKKIIESNRMFLECKENDYTSQGGVRWIDCKTISMVLKDGYVSKVSFEPRQLTIKQVIDKYGSPDAMEAGILSLPEFPVRSKATLRYDIIQAQIILPENPGSEYRISPDLQVESVTYYGKNGYDYIKEIISSPWFGYNIYESKLP